MADLKSVFVPSRCGSAVLSATYGLFGIGSSCLVIWYVSIIFWVTVCPMDGWVGRRVEMNASRQLGRKTM